ncbi:MAG: methionine--tRNA ligase [Candidatus Moraniibacteriota bacterium]
MNKTYYVTTTLPYVNGTPHIGFALEIIEADVLARYHSLSGDAVVFNTGTDEHGVNIYRKALELGKTPQAYVDEMAENFSGLKSLLNLSVTHFARTTDAHHIAAAQEFWRRCHTAGDIYKKEYRIKYCTGCELEKTESELDKTGHCLLHPTKDIEIIEEENYFFRWSKYQEALLKLYADRPEFVIPAKRLNEIRNFVAGGLQDFSISRLKEKMPWGIPVPDDDAHVMYVWFDALVNYISTLGWPENTPEFERWWPGIQIAGKDNLRQQAAMWQAMLISAGLPTSKQILLNGFINVAGQKMSKTLGNVISPAEMVERYGVDGTRYLLLSLGSLGEDFDVTWERMTEKYNADLANGLGNLVSRVMRLASNLQPTADSQQQGTQELEKFMAEYRIADGLEYIWAKVREANQYVDETKPWELVKTDEKKFAQVMENLLNQVGHIASLLKPFLPSTSEKIETALKTGKVEPLFQRIKTEK